MNCSELPLFGMCPFYDQTLLVTCNICKLIVKLPQLSEHLSKRHNICDVEPTESNCKTIENNQKTTQEQNVKLKTVVEKIKNKISNNSQSITISSELKTTSNSLETSLNTPNFSKNPIVSPTTTTPTTSSNHKSPLIPSPNSNNNSLLAQKNQKIPINKSVRVYDPDKHCGVLTDLIDPLTGQSNGKDRCLRSLTCKKHPINLRRQVSGRSKPFNELLKEYKKEKPVPNTLEIKPEIETLNKTPTSIQKQRRPFRKSDSSPSPLIQSSPKLETKLEPNPILVPISQPVFPRTTVYPEPSFQLPGIISDFKAPIQLPGQKINLNNLHLQFVKHHPRPSAVTSYNARLTDGGGYTLWNRRQDNLRLILSKTFIETEKYINNRNQDFLAPSNTTTIPMGPNNSSLKRSFPFTSLIKSSSLSQVDTIHKLNDYLIDGDIFQDDEEDTDAAKFAKLNDNNEKTMISSSLSPSPSSSSSNSSSLSHQQFLAQSSKLI
ncbi:unnamed protein product [Brachionus calyciflorus]|uniref:SCA7 domain-containing protein n=1 Tax=Brachionus calyciflorus TaxID=104777 RepID=A0A814KI45_9BILA|nr:unnamed protein product [Brachionus calyciflorus]